jgi:hypothetical protein
MQSITVGEIGQKRTECARDCARRLLAGVAVIVFDEHFNYPGWQGGEFKAFAEFVETRGVSFEYLGYCRYYEQVAVGITARP